MFRLEKVFQNDDKFFINSLIFIKALIILLSVYIFSILQRNTIYELLEFNIYIESNFYLFSIYFATIYLLTNIIITKDKKYKSNFLSYLRNDLLPFLISMVISFSIFFLFKINLKLDLSFLYLIIFIIINLSILNRSTSSLYNYLINSNIIQRNIMLVGNINDIKKIVNENKDKINVYKCCLINTSDINIIHKLRMDLKIPIFGKNEDIRSILEYHSLGQIWILDNKKNDIDAYLKSVLKFSVDILVINIIDESNLYMENVINNKYKFRYFEISKFHGFNLFIKILFDKILALFFLLLLSPVIIISIVCIYIEDGYPILFTQDRTGWDGRRFKIFKLRSLKSEKFDKTVQVTNNDKRLLTIGKIIRRFSIDELPQFINVLIGDMSVVGPRPHMVEHDIKYSAIFSGFLKRHKSNPGLTGWAQVNGLRGATPTPDLMEKRMKYTINRQIWGSPSKMQIKTVFVMVNHLFPPKNEMIYRFLRSFCP